MTVSYKKPSVGPLFYNMYHKIKFMLKIGLPYANSIIYFTRFSNDLWLFMFPNNIVKISENLNFFKNLSPLYLPCRLLHDLQPFLV